MNKLSEADIFREVCENDFAFFAKHFLKVVEPETVFDWNWHMTVLCHYCERVYYGDIQNLDINISPRTLKSIIVSVLFPCWIWTKRPSFKIISGSRSYDLSIQFNSKRREVIESRAYQSLWPMAFKNDSNAAGKFGNFYNGFMQAVSAGGKIVGVGGDLLLSDDLLDTMDAFSEAKRNAVNNWYSTAFYNRAQYKRKVMRININQRLHKNDVSGHIEEKHNFEKLVIPMVMTEKPLSTVDFVDPRKPGEFMHPSRYGQDEMEDDYKSLGIYGWSSQMQQTPRPIGGGIIKEEWLRYYEGIISFERKIITADLTFKGDTDSDYVCFQCWGKSGKNKYLIDIVRGRWSYKVSKEMFIQFCQKNSSNNKFIEDKANGPALISDLEKEIVGIKAWPPKGSPYYKASKVQRLHMVSQDYEAGLVYFPKDIELVNLFKEELLSFTEKGSSTGNDDMVDTSTMALIELKKSNTFFAG